MKFFIGGFSWGQNGSQLERFLNDGIWQNGYGGEVYHDIYENPTIYFCIPKKPLNSSGFFGMLSVFN